MIQEMLEQVLNELRSAMRFRWVGMAVVWLACVAGWLWVALQPNVFEANARVFVDSSSVLQPVLGNQIIASNTDAQLAYVREALLGRVQLESVAEEIGLGGGVQSGELWESTIGNLRTAIRIDSAGRTRNQPDSIYSITYRNADRTRAVGVVDSILDKFVESTLGANRLEGDTAEEFLDARVQEYEARLAQAEQALADFKKQNADRLPGAEGDYFQRMQAERDALGLANRELRILQSKRQTLAQQLRGEREVVSGVGGIDLEPAPNSIDARIRDLESQLDTMLLEYTERHPGVVGLRDQLERLRAQRTADLAALGVDDVGQEMQTLAANPMYQQLQISMSQTEVDLAAIRADISERDIKVAELRALIDEVPEVEAQLARLNRDYDVVYQQYLQLARSRETQELSRKATETDQVDFRIINPPLASFAPVAPNRVLLLTLILGAALAAGAGLCYLLAQLWPVFSTRASLRQQIGLPVLGVVMHAWQDQQQTERRKQLGLYAAALAMLVLVFGGLLGIETFGPGTHQLIGGGL